MNQKLFQFNLGVPFCIKDIDRLFYACNYLDSDKCFLMDKEKFEILCKRGLIKEYSVASNL